MTIVDFTSTPTPLTINFITPAGTVLRADPLVVDVTSLEALQLVLVYATFPETGISELAYDGIDFRGFYQALSMRTAITNGFRFTVARSSGWTSSPKLEVVAVDARPSTARADRTWALPPASAAAASSTATATPSPRAINPADEFLGFGLIQPLRRDGKSDFVASGGAALVRGAVHQVLGTRCDGPSTQGEVRWRTRFGSLLYLLKHANNDVQRREMARAYATEALQRWEPRIRVTDVSVQAADQAGAQRRRMEITVSYRLATDNTDENQVTLFGSEDSVTVGVSV